ncbi:MAG: superoxide dismutase [Oscillochloris sp.]|nr:superoxide dismutase [Oscillochloris sp.]
MRSTTTSSLLMLVSVLGLSLIGVLTPTAFAQEPQKIIQLPNAWLPEGVVTGNGPVIYSGSRADGAVYAADLISGEGRILVPGREGRIAVGLAYDARSNLIFVAGGPGGAGYVYNAGDGSEAGGFQFVNDGGGTFVNDVIVTADGAFFTDSQRAVLYRIPLGSSGELPDAAAVETIQLGGEYRQIQGFNANGIEATPDGEALIIVHSSLGLLYRVDPQTGAATEIDIGGPSVAAGDGILLQGNTLYVVRNRRNLITKINLAPDASSGRVIGLISDPAFDVPTTVAAYGDYLYAVNARFGTPNTPETTYSIVRVAK